MYFWTQEIGKEPWQSEEWWGKWPELWGLHSSSGGAKIPRETLYIWAEDRAKGPCKAVGGHPERRVGERGPFILLWFAQAPSPPLSCPCLEQTQAAKALALNRKALNTRSSYRALQCELDPTQPDEAFVN